MFTSAHAIVMATIAGTFVVAGCSSPQQAPPVEPQAVSTPAVAPAIPAADRPPPELAAIGESAEGVFDAARLSKWNDAAVTMRALKESVSVLPSAGLKADLVGQLTSRVGDVERSVTARQKIQSMDFANSITRLVAELSSSEQVEIPYKIVLLGYYGRQLQLGIAASRRSTLTQATADVRQTWNSIERDILRRGQVDDARHFTDIVVQLEGAKRPADFVAPARAELAAVDQLEKIFKP